MKKRIRKSSLIKRKRHGYRSKPSSHTPRGKKRKNIKLMLKSRRKNRARVAGRT